jgi:hypothetical protein
MTSPVVGGAERSPGGVLGRTGGVPAARDPVHAPPLPSFGPNTARASASVVRALR